MYRADESRSRSPGGNGATTSDTSWPYIGRSAAAPSQSPEMPTLGGGGVVGVGGWWWGGWWCGLGVGGGGVGVLTRRMPPPLTASFPTFHTFGSYIDAFAAPRTSTICLEMS